MKKTAFLLFVLSRLTQIYKFLCIKGIDKK